MHGVAPRRAVHAGSHHPAASGGGHGLSALTAAPVASSVPPLRRSSTIRAARDAPPLPVSASGGTFGRFGLLRYKLFILSTPVVVVTMLIRLALDQTIGFTGIISENTVQPLSWLAMFVISTFILGVIEDYKEAEKLPGAFANLLDGMSEKIDFVAHMAARTPGCPPLDALRCQRELLEYATCLFEFMADLRSAQEMLALTRAVGAHLAEAYTPLSAHVDTDTWMVWGQMDQLRALLTRLSVIKRTDVVSGAATLMSALSYVVLFVSALGSYSTPYYVANPDDPQWVELATYVNILAYGYVFVYTLFLTADMEDPFEFSVAAMLPKAPPRAATGGGGHHGGGDGGDDDEGRSEGTLEMGSANTADVDVFPLLELYARLAVYAGRDDIVHPDTTLARKLRSALADLDQSAHDAMRCVDAVDAEAEGEQDDDDNEGGGGGGTSDLSKRRVYRVLLAQRMRAALGSDDLERQQRFQQQPRLAASGAAVSAVGGGDDEAEAAGAGSRRMGRVMSMRAGDGSATAAAVAAAKTALARGSGATQRPRRPVPLLRAFAAATLRATRRLCACVLLLCRCRGGGGGGSGARRRVGASSAGGAMSGGGSSSSRFRLAGTTPSSAGAVELWREVESPRSIIAGDGGSGSLLSPSAAGGAAVAATSAAAAAMNAASAPRLPLSGNEVIRSPLYAATAADSAEIREA